MYVFRESRWAAPAGRLLVELTDSIRRAASSEQSDVLLDALLRAGELECSLADSGHDEAAAKIAGVSDCLASALVRGDRLAVAESCVQILDRVELFGELGTRVPEGFAYYGLHPLDYARATERFLDNWQADSAGVIGIRTIGTTLSAIVAAAFRQHRVPASRTTVRPTGHPFERECAFSLEQREWVSERTGAHFVIVDEGPGLSGSSFLSVARALEQQGIARQQITFFCNHLPNSQSFKSPRSREEWGNYSALETARNEAEAGNDLSFGTWKQLLFGAGDEPPSSWAQMERRKFLIGGSEFRKFEGFGKYGEAAFQRASQVAEAGFGATVLGRAEGYTRYRWQEGERLEKESLSDAVIGRMVEYCAFRAQEFSGDESVQEAVDLESMTRVNLLEEFGTDEVACDLSALSRNPKVVTDSRMHPHYWLRMATGEILKTSAILHGDDHLFPGPCDIAWDLAGGIVEWEMGQCVASHLLAAYRAHTGDDVRPRIEAFVTAYAAFRMGYCKMAAEAMVDSDEEARLRRDFLRCRDLLASRVNTTHAAKAA